MMQEVQTIIIPEEDAHLEENRRDVLTNSVAGTGLKVIV
jgi:hypothetical protein